VNFLLKCNKKRSIEILFRPLPSAFVKRIFAIEAWDLLDFGQADIRNPLSLLTHNQIAATQLIRRGLPLLIQASPHHCLLPFTIEAEDFLDLVKLR